MKKTRVLIVDDHTLVRDGIRALLMLAADIDVVGEACNGMEAMERIKELLPDVVLLDLAMPIMNGLDTTRKIHKEFPRTKVLALTQYDDSEYVVPVIEAGARGFVTKAAAFSELATAIQAIASGDSYLSPSAASALIEECQHKVASSNGDKDAYQSLTEREHEVLKLVAEGYTAKEIANMLCITTKTVEWHKTSLMNKLNIHNKTELIKFAIRKAIIEL
ncbi:response regulator [Chloroflexota bacterium]